MINITTEEALKEALANKMPDLHIANNLDITEPIIIGYEVKITGAPGVSLFWTNPTARNRQMITIKENGLLTIENLILDAQNRNGTLVYLLGGTFVMEQDSILRNIKSTTACNAVRIGDFSSPLNGTLIMNHGLITGIDSSDAIYCHGGKVFMHNEAAVDNNQSAGVTMQSASIGGTRPILVMTGTSSISNNQSKQGASAGILVAADVIMGVNPSDAPTISNNQSVGYPIAAFYCTENSTLTMRYQASISNNYSSSYIGGLALAYGSTLLMYDNSSITGNKSDNYNGGLILSDSSATLFDNASITNNQCLGNGGGVFLQRNATLNLFGQATISRNSALNGGGIFLSSIGEPSKIILGNANSAPKIIENTATNDGGGIYVDEYSVLSINGHSLIASNKAQKGQGIYKNGSVLLMDSVQIRDGLYYDNLDEDNLDNSPRETENVPLIIGKLTSSAKIQLEKSNYLNLTNVPLVIAKEGESYHPLLTEEKNSFLLPKEFGPGYQIVISDGQRKLQIIEEIFIVSYQDLRGATTDNPRHYQVSELPIILTPPTQNPGLKFEGWEDEDGKTITEIPIGETQNLRLKARWKQLYLRFNGNIQKAFNIPCPIKATINPIMIPYTIPHLCGYRFVCWYHPLTHKKYFPGSLIDIVDDDLTLLAHWTIKIC